METLEEMLERHKREKAELAIRREKRLEELIRQYGKTLPPEIYNEWEISHSEKWLSSDHEAEIEAYPLHPMDIVYQEIQQKQTQLETTKELNNALIPRQMKHIQDEINASDERGMKLTEEKLKLLEEHDKAMYISWNIYNERMQGLDANDPTVQQLKQEQLQDFENRKSHREQASKSYDYAISQEYNYGQNLKNVIAQQENLGSTKTIEDEMNAYMAQQKAKEQALREEMEGVKKKDIMTELEEAAKRQQEQKSKDPNIDPWE
ncbi:hypothetical protein [Runella zeae]|uniref:hypothetical protein n=1 Tax=Runella zeae TaxID=94255 RepID=UPI000420D3B8|nr:hypothetical protein [Runella zeae]